MKRKKRILWIVSMLLVGVLAIAGFGIKEMIMDTDQRIVYQNEDVEYFLIRLSSNAGNVKSLYANQYVMMLGKVRSKNGNKGIKLGMISEFSKSTLSCSTSKVEIQESLSNVHVGDYVKVYGKMTVSIFGDWNLAIDKVERTFETEISRTAFSTISGRTMDRDKMEKRTLNDQKITYYVPEEWVKVEKNLRASNLGKVEGYQYCLNEINEDSVYPESLFVFYFDNEAMLMNTSDKSKTEQIERAIVKNLLKDDPGTAKKRILGNYYGATYHYYQQAYKSSVGKNYHGEFIFQPDGKKGFIVYFYVYYNDKSHLDDVMLMLRMVEP